VQSQLARKADLDRSLHAARYQQRSALCAGEMEIAGEIGFTKATLGSTWPPFNRMASIASGMP